MRLLQVINSLGAGGAETLVANTSIHYKNAGIDVAILVLDPTPTPLHTKLRAHNIPILSINAVGKSIYNPLNILKLRRLLKPFPLVHAHLFPTAYWLALAKLWGHTNIKLLYTEHNTTNRRRKLTVFKLLDRYIYKQFDSIISISDAVDSSLKTHLGAAFHPKITKIYNGVDVAAFTNAQPYTKTALGLAATDVLVIQVASFTAQKDQATAIKALTLVPAHIKLALVGTGPLLQAAQAQVHALNLTARVHFLGVRDDVPQLLKTADVVVLASHYEGLSLSCIEGMASGAPFIASDTPGLGAIVKHHGLVFPDADAEALANHITTLLDNPALYTQTVANCLKRAADFDIHKMIQEHIQLYKRLN
ncbi:glycosyltransferase [Seonamhaeicola algicola]|uniref:Glycosyltransferase n=1 Tax=Seonamhaeicola algicola TaxID=1719036 RepID=A0A5C7AYU4_9FLAO|nr:glycosyltransferase [Seonamhaeicola algicola]TXE11665.1 glycosyltransferase [Seonamhaeicola algicola]